MANPGRSLLSLAGLLATALTVGPQRDGPARPEGRDWKGEMRRVHARFQGRPGTFAHFGDSITETLTFWTPLKDTRKDTSPEMADAFRRVDAYMRPECWRDWKGPEFGNQGGRTTRWAEQNVGTWLGRLDPEVALVMFGTNDLRECGVDEYRDRLRSVVRQCLNRGTVVILSTIPPRHGMEEKAAAFADAAREVARELAVPLIDYHAEILKRRPDDWDGASDELPDIRGLRRTDPAGAGRRASELTEAASGRLLGGGVAAATATASQLPGAHEVCRGHRGPVGDSGRRVR